MTAAARTAVNRANALRSTGPRTVGGKAVSSQNALRSGLFARLVVVEAAGETADAFERFRTGVVDDMAPAGAVEAELVDRVAAILWRLRRVVRYEAAAAAARVTHLPPDPNDIAADSQCVYRTPAANDPPWVRLAAVRHLTRSNRRSAATTASAAAWLDAPAAESLDREVADAVVTAASKLLGWALVADPSPWDPILAAAGADPPKLFAFPWTGELLTAALDGAARAAGRDPTAFRSELRAAVHTESGRLTELAATREEEERELVDRMTAERQRAGALAMYADDAVAARVAKAEAHLTRELDRTLTLLDRVRGLGPAGGAAPPPRVVQVGNGFALPPGA